MYGFYSISSLFGTKFKGETLRKVETVWVGRVPYDWFTTTTHLCNFSVVPKEVFYQ